MGFDLDHTIRKKKSYRKSFDIFNLVFTECVEDGCKYSEFKKVFFVEDIDMSFSSLIIIIVCCYFSTL